MRIEWIGIRIVSEVKNYKDLLVWQKAMNMVEHIYKISASFPADERFGLTSQIRKAAVSIPSNIAEGSSRKSTAEFIRFCNIAYGSLAETETQIMIAERLEFVGGEAVAAVLNSTDELAKMLSGLIRALAEKSGKITQLSTLNSQL